jgi:hypothetical protein
MIITRIKNYNELNKMLLDFFNCNNECIISHVYNIIYNGINEDTIVISNPRIEMNVRVNYENNNKDNHIYSTQQFIRSIMINGMKQKISRDINLYKIGTEQKRIYFELKNYFDNIDYKKLILKFLNKEIYDRQLLYSNCLIIKSLNDIFNKLKTSKLKLSYLYDDVELKYDHAYHILLLYNKIDKKNKKGYIKSLPQKGYININDYLNIFNVDIDNYIEYFNHHRIVFSLISFYIDLNKYIIKKNKNTYFIYLPIKGYDLRNLVITNYFYVKFLDNDYIDFYPNGKIYDNQESYGEKISKFFCLVKDIIYKVCDIKNYKCIENIKDIDENITIKQEYDNDFKLLKNFQDDITINFDKNKKLNDYKYDDINNKKNNIKIELINLINKYEKNNNYIKKIKKNINIFIEQLEIRLFQYIKLKKNIKKELTKKQYNKFKNKYNL